MTQGQKIVAQRLSQPIVWLGVVAVLLGVTLLVRQWFVTASSFAPGEVALATQGWVILAAEGQLSAAEIAATHSILGFLLVLATQSLTGLSAATASTVTSVLLATAVAWHWVRNFRQAGQSLAIAAGLAVMLMASPAFHAAMAAGPDVMQVLVANWLLMRTMFPLHRHGDTDALMLASGTLIVLLLSGPLGMACAIAGGIALLVCLPRNTSRRDVPTMMMVLLFPPLLALAGLLFVNWALAHYAFGFVPDSLLFGPGPFDAPWTNALRVIGLVFLACPLVILALLARRHASRPVLALLVSMVMLATLAHVFALATVPVIVAVATVPASAALAARWDNKALPTGFLLGSLVATAVVCSLLMTLGAFGSDAADHARQDEQLGRQLIAMDDVMIDASQYPVAVATRGSADGLVAASDTAFAVAVLEKTPRAANIAVRQPDPSRPADAISRAFPDLFTEGSPGYTLAYDHGGWRLWTRQPHFSQDKLQ